MNRPFILLAALAAAVPASAVAQAWPATVVAGAPRVVQAAKPAPGANAFALGASRQPVAATPARPRLRLSTVDIGEVPQVDIRPRDEWFDDQGLRVGPTRIAFKRRF